MTLSFNYGELLSRTARKLQWLEEEGSDLLEGMSLLEQELSVECHCLSLNSVSLCSKTGQLEPMANIPRGQQSGQD